MLSRSASRSDLRVTEIGKPIFVLRVGEIGKPIFVLRVGEIGKPISCAGDYSR